MDSTDKSTDKNAKKMANLMPPWPKGVSGNPKGMAKGTHKFQTLWKLAIEKIAADEGITPEQAEINMIVAGYKHAKKGNFPYYKDLLDRHLGKMEDDRPTVVVIPILGGKSVVPVDDSDKENTGAEEKN